VTGDRQGRSTITAPDAAARIRTSNDVIDASIFADKARC